MTAETLAGLLALWFVLDTALTYQLISRRGGRELNPIMRWAIGELGLEEALVLAKFLALTLIWFFTVDGTFNGNEKWLWYLHAGYAGVVAWNGFQLIKSR